MTKRAPDVYVIVLDTLRVAEGPTGPEAAQTMPWLSAWASREAVSYARGVSVAPWTLPAHASLFTGHYPTVHGAHERHLSLGARLPTMAEWFKDNGYRTAGVSANAWVGPEFGLGRGFDLFVRAWQLRKADSEVTRLLKSSQHLSRLEKGKRVLATRRPADLVNMSFRFVRRRIRYGDFDAGAVNREALGIVRDAGPDPLFLFVNLMEAHAPYWGPRRHRRRFLGSGTSFRAARRIPQSSSRVNAGVARVDERGWEVLRGLYRAEVRYLDDRMEQLLGSIDRHRGLDNAVVVVVSDHGDNIGDHGLIGHNYSVWETLLHVPVVIRYPGGADGGSRDLRLAQTADLLPTVVDAVGGSLGSPVGGVSLLSGPSREIAVAEYLAPMPSLETMRLKYPNADLSRFDRSLRALRTADDEKFIWDSRGEHHLYDLRADPGETANLVTERPDRAGELSEALGEWVRQFGDVADLEPSSAPIDEEVRRRLEAMGYLA